MIYFTSDLHLGHNAIIYMRERPFRDIDEMNRKLIGNINSLISDRDTLYILGDIAHHLTIEEANALIAQIHGRKILLRGNHDKDYDPSLFVDIRDYLEIKDEGVRFDLMHYPLRSWHGMRHGAIQLHGHIHAGMDYNLANREKGIYQYDVGVDANGYFPVPINAIHEFFKDVTLTVKKLQDV